MDLSNTTLPMESNATEFRQLPTQLPNQMQTPVTFNSLSHMAQEMGSTTAGSVTPMSNSIGGRGRVSPPAVEVKLFVGRVPRDCDENQLRVVFSEFGVVRDVIIIRDRDTSIHKGCAFVRMASITKADSAIRSLNNIRVLDSGLGPLQVKYAFGEPERLGLLIDNAQPGVDQAKLFVGSLPKSATEEDILAVFARFGDVDEVFLMRDDQKVSKGCAFVRFAFKEEAFNAIAHFNGKYTMPGATRAMEVRFAENKKAQQQQMLQQQSHGSQSFNAAQQSSIRSGVSNPGWLEYVSPEGRPYYYCIQTGLTQWERPVELDSPASTAQPNIVPGGVGAQTHGPPGANVFIFHIPNEWSEHDLVSHFSAFGQIVSARIATDKGTGRRLGFGFVSFSTIEASVHAVLALNGYSVSGKRLKVTIKRGEEQYATPFLPAGFSSPQLLGEMPRANNQQQQQQQQQHQQQLPQQHQSNSEFHPRNNQRFAFSGGLQGGASSMGLFNGHHHNAYGSGGNTPNYPSNNFGAYGAPNSIATAH